MVIQGKPLNVITLAKHIYKHALKSSRNDPFQMLIALEMITLSGFHCTTYGIYFRNNQVFSLFLLWKKLGKAMAVSLLQNFLNFFLNSTFSFLSRRWRQICQVNVKLLYLSSMRLQFVDYLFVILHFCRNFHFQRHPNLVYITEILTRVVKRIE